MRTCNGIRNGNTKIVIVTVITAVMLLGTTALTTITITESVLAYRTNHATSQVNDCGNGELPLNVGCQNTGSQIQGDRNSVALSSKQTFPPPPPTTGTLTIKKIVQCVEGRECPGLPQPEDFLITVPTSNNPQPEPVQGSTGGTSVPLSPGGYSTDEPTRSDDPEGLFFVESELSTDCSSDVNGPILAGEERECTITNTYAPTTVGVLKVIKNIECVPEEDCPNLPPASIFTMFVFSVSTISFEGSSQGTLVALQPGNYFTAENEPPVPAGLEWLDPTFSTQCNGPIQAGEMRTCIWTNTYAPLEQIP